jgi:Arc/MetJ family transcription regulator
MAPTSPAERAVVREPAEVGDAAAAAAAAEADCEGEAAPAVLAAAPAEVENDDCCHMDESLREKRWTGVSATVLRQTPGVDNWKTH